MRKKQDATAPVSPASYDLIIVGGGPVGSLVAFLAASQGFSCAVVDQRDPEEKAKASWDGRTTSIAYGTSLILEEAGVWAFLKPHSHSILSIGVTQEGASGFLGYEARDVGSHPLGYMVPNCFLHKILGEKLANTPGIDLYAPNTLESWGQGPWYCEGLLRGGTVLKAPLLIGADGKNSPLREKAAIPKWTWSYDQVCLVFTASHQNPHDHKAYEHFHPAGPLATLPLEDKTSAIVWTDTPERIQTLLALPPADFHEALNRHILSPLGPLRCISPLWHYPLSGLFAKRLYAQRLALVGDAGHSVHPVAGQGMNLGFRDAKTLVDLLVSHKNLGLDWGTQVLLKDYDRARKIDNASMALMTHGLIRLFSNDFGPLQKIRGVGLSMVNKISFAKRLIARHAMGLPQGCSVKSYNALIFP